MNLFFQNIIYKILKKEGMMNMETLSLILLIVAIVVAGIAIIKGASDLNEDKIRMESCQDLNAPICKEYFNDPKSLHFIVRDKQAHGGTLADAMDEWNYLKNNNL